MRRWLVPVSAAVVATFALGAVGVALASATIAAVAVQANADRVLSNVGKHTGEVRAALQLGQQAGLPRTSASDAAAAQRSVEDAASKMLVTVNRISTDEAGLLSARDRLEAQQANALTAAARPGLDRQQRRIKSVLAALAAASTGLGVARDQSSTLYALLGAIADANNIANRLGTGDLAGSLYVFSDLTLTLQTAATYANRANNSPEVRRAVSAMQTYSEDMDALLQALRRKDGAASRSLTPRVQADLQQVETLDPAALASYERLLLQPYVDGFRAGLRAAGLAAGG